MANELSVELRLKLDKLKGDSARAGQQVRSDLASSVKGLAPTNMERQTQSERISRAQRNRKLDEADAEKERKASAMGKLMDSAKAMALRFATIAGILMILRKEFQLLSSAVENARNLYAKQLRSGGMAAGFVTQRAQLAEVIGVGEKEVYQYGAAIGYLNDKLAFSTKIFTDTTPTLTALSWEWKVMGQDMKAFWAQAATKLAPALFLLAKTGSLLTKVMTQLQDSFMFPGIATILKLGGGLLMPKAPGVPISTERMPASAWEKMGLVIGQGGGTNYARKTAEGTTKSAQYLEKIANAVGGVPRTGQQQFDALQNHP
jgi:hypothetical protein